MGFMFFKTNRGQSSNKIYYPILNILYNDVCYRIEGTLYYIKGGNAYKFYSDRAFRSWRLDPVDANYIWPPEYMQPKTLGFRDGTLIQNAKDGRIYLISSSKKRLITAPLGDYGFDYSQVVEASDAEIQFHGDGEDI